MVYGRLTGLGIARNSHASILLFFLQINYSCVCVCMEALGKVNMHGYVCIYVQLTD